MLSPPAHPGTTPVPVYVASDWRGTARPEPLPADEKTRARAAAAKALQRYPGPAGLVLADALRTYEEIGYLIQGSCAVRRLIDELVD